MFIERLILKNFCCFGPESQTISLSPHLTAFIGTNGTGKTAALRALQRLFGVTEEQRRVRRQDFHVPPIEEASVLKRDLTVEIILSFPELACDSSPKDSVPPFFNHMIASQDGIPQCRFHLEATWTDDGSLDGVIESKFYAIKTLGEFTENDRFLLNPMDRARIQMIYIPAVRDGASQVTSFLRSRLWRSIEWSSSVRDTFHKARTTLNEAFNNEDAIKFIASAVKKRWGEVHSAGTDVTPVLQPIDPRFEDVIRKVEVVFHYDEFGRARILNELSDGQRSLFHLAMTAAILDIEQHIVENTSKVGFQIEKTPFPALTLIAIEEPENSLSPFYLSRIISQLETLTQNKRAQAIISSHSASTLGRIDPSQVRHFRLTSDARAAKVSSITLPQDTDEETLKFIREAVRSYPELYFARFVVLGEGASEEVLLPSLAEAFDFHIDRSFVAIVPLGGRHVNHLWRLLSDLEIPYATLLDLDWGRHGGGWGRIKTTCHQLLKYNHLSKSLFKDFEDPNNLSDFDKKTPNDLDGIREWTEKLHHFNVFFCEPLDLDYSMLCSFPDAYKSLKENTVGPYSKGDLKNSVLGKEEQVDFYTTADGLENLRWYRYLFLGRSKPSTHVRALSHLSPKEIKDNIPKELKALLDTIIKQIQTLTQK